MLFYTEIVECELRAARLARLTSKKARPVIGWLVSLGSQANIEKLLVNG